MKSINNIIPSILSADFSILKEQMCELENNDIKTIHIDIMDGSFVSNISFGFPILQCIRKITNLKLDVHIMINNPIRYIHKFVESGADIITIHIEGDNNTKEILKEIKKYNVKSGIALNPKTQVCEVKNFLHLVDQVLVMSVNPGFGGQEFIESSIDKIQLLNQIRFYESLDFNINVDGGIKSTNYKRILKSGANNIIVGYDVFKNNKISENIKMFN